MRTHLFPPTNPKNPPQPNMASRSHCGSSSYSGSSSTLLETRRTHFVIQDHFQPDLNCQVFVTVKTLRYENGDEYYDIGYRYQYNSEDAKHLNPFESSPLSQSDEGDIIKKNDMIKVMVDYLLMEEDQLVEMTGKTCPIEYKSQIMRALSLFWD